MAKQRPAPLWAKIGIGTCVAVIAIVWLLPEQKTLDTETDLASYTAAPQDHRATLIGSFLNDAERDIAPLFVTCVDSNAPTKNSDILVSTVVGWCRGEQQNNPEQFASHVSTLDDPNLSTQATVICRNALRAQVRQGELDFPWIPDLAEMTGKNTYLVTSVIGATAPGGVTGRVVYTCNARYKGEGDKLDQSSWEILSLTVEEAV